MQCLCVNLTIREEDGFPDGIPSAHGAEDLVRELEARPDGNLTLEALELSLYTLDLGQVERILKAVGQGLTGVRMAIKMGGEADKKRLIDIIRNYCEEKGTRLVSPFSIL